MRYVDTEAHYWTDDFVAYMRTRSVPPKQVPVKGGYQTFFEPSAPELSLTIRERLVSGLNDLGDRRLEAMEVAGVDVAILSLSGPGSTIRARSATRLGSVGQRRTRCIRREAPGPAVRHGSALPVPAARRCGGARAVREGVRLPGAPT